ncbi:MAG: GHKL domain-containing protein [Methylococcaceae bacterium]|nr:GHKL domain-containing protein [Methylococcaceae bacterium]
MTTQNLQKARKSEQLTNAFHIFNELSQNLSNSYQGLEEQIAKLNRELAFARSERLKTLEEKEKLANHLEKILAALPAGVIVLDAQGKIVNCNSVAINFLGEPIVERIWAEVMARSLIFVSNNPHECQLVSGKRINMTTSQLENDSGQIILLSDVSEMRTLQDVLNQQKHLSAMGEMVASMAHQVRTPLATAILYASQLSKPLIDKEKKQRFSEKILERLLYLERQVNDMLIFAKDGRLAMEQFSLATLLTHLSDGFRDYVGQDKIELKIINTLSDDEMIGNENALRGALMNLLNNAVDAIGVVVGTITVSVSQYGGHVRIAIRDNGPGVAEELRQRIFEPFFTTKPSGTGLGLAVVDSVIRAHGGKIQIDSTIGRGTVFNIMLPDKNQTLSLLPGGFSGKAIAEREMRHETV